jgi:serine/threonine-protein kinase
MDGELKVGSGLDGRFGIFNLIGKGALASIFEAIDERTGGTMAVKVPLPGYERDPVYLWRFEHEEKIGGALNHPSIIRVCPVRNKSRPYIVMDRLEGTTLSGLLKESQPMPVPEALRIGVEIARVLEYLHGENVVHRDLKSQNVFVSRDGSIRLIDLGLAKYGKGPEPRVALAQAFGTPDYMPPEQVMERSGDPRSDLDALGAMLYEMTTGQVPFRDEDPFVVMHARIEGDPPAPRAINPALSPGVEEIILRAMERDPCERYQSASEMKRDLENPEAVSPTGRASGLEVPRPWRIVWRRSIEFVWTLIGMIGFITALSFVALKFGKHR